MAIAVEQPAWRQARAANELKKLGREGSPFGERSIGLLHETMQKRLKSLDAKMVQKGGVLTEARLITLEAAV